MHSWVVDSWLPWWVTSTSKNRIWLNCMLGHCCFCFMEPLYQLRAMWPNGLKCHQIKCPQVGLEQGGGDGFLDVFHKQVDDDLIATP